ncbi:LacI family DNA-binding transcriptional regulator [Vagococcus teuberi]|uniref:LacI family transcriptional regulator n=1 Tax=Vagococcus teuberi TaxID=519472 RepID=A0A1J0A471_9ENTE|nr:LacI family DNA-binding transcriptional regulator [Vagococcus teuberi]APB30741.1 LacI family transcriptional regulator [Vagococcus teuberi]
MKATMKDVAALAGVGVGTVSRVINGIKVKEQTKDKVESAIEILNYERNEYARGLKKNKTNTLALIVPTIWHPFFSEFAYYVEEELSKEGYKLYLCNSNGEADKEKEYIQMVKQNKVDGIIGVTYSDIDKYVSANLPFVSIDRYFTEDVYYVTSDNLLGGKIAASELIKRKVQYPAYISSVSKYKNETLKRYEGFSEYCEDHNLSVVKLMVDEPRVNFVQQVEQFLIEHPEIDGIFAVNDLTALDIIKVLDKLERKVGEDIQIIGFDGSKTALDQNYLLSTIRQQVDKMAEVSVQNIIKLIDGNEVPKRVMLPVKFVEGYTTKKNIDIIEK